MMYRKTLSIVAGLIFAMTGVMAQSMDDGFKQMYYGNYQSAKQVFEQVISSKPTDGRAYYYAAMSQLGLEDEAGAKATLQKGSAAVPNDPLIMVGLGRIDLVEGNSAAARQKFEAALTATNNKNGEVSRAVADANTETKGGDRKYALAVMEKLFDNSYVKKRDQYEPTVQDQVELGDAYRYLGGEYGGRAINAYEKALEMDPKYAEAIMKQGLVNYNANLLQQAVNDFARSTEVDPKYSPAYYELYQFYFTQKKSQFDLGKAKQYLQKYLETADPSDRIKNEYYLASIMFFDKDYDGAITKAQSLMSIANDSYKAKLNRLIADAYLQKGDAAKAQEVLDKYVASVGEDKLEPLDYKILSEVYGHVKTTDSTTQAANEQKALMYLEKFAESDTTLDADRIEEVAKAYTNARVFTKAGEWYQKLVNYKTKKNTPPSALDYYNVGLSYYRAAAGETIDTNLLNRADTAFAMLAEKYPDITTGHYWRGMANAGKDTEAKSGVAKPYFEKYISMAEGDTEKNKAGLIKAYTYIMVYYYNIKDEAQMKVYMDKLAPIDPQNEAMLQIKGIMSEQKSQSNK